MKPNNNKQTDGRHTMGDSTLRHRSISAGARAPSESEEAPVHISYQRCDDCGRQVPETNLSLHRATYHHERPRADEGRDVAHETRSDQSHASPGDADVVMAEPVVRCDVCNRDIPRMSMMVHTATCHRNENENNGNSRNSAQTQVGENEAIEVIMDEAGSEEAVVTTSSPPVPAAASHPSVATTSASTDHEQQQQQQQWSCPRCTLLNPSTSNQCDACLYMNLRVQPSARNSAGARSNVQVEVQEMDPRMVAATGAATSIASFGLLGGLVGGPVGALVGAGAGAVMNGVTHFNNQRSGRRPTPHFTFTTVTRSSQEGGESTMRVMSNRNADGRYRSVTVRSHDGGPNFNNSAASPIDQMILQMLVLNALNQGAVNTDQMTYDELLQRFGVGNENRRGASQEAINEIPVTNLDNKALEELEENQKVCNICLEDFKEGDVMRKTKCDHTFHKGCLDRWLAQVASCPICKHEVDEINGTGHAVASGHNHHIRRR